MYTTQHTTQSRLCVFVGIGFFDFFSNKTHAAETSRGSMGSDFVVQEGLTTAEICRKTGFYKQFVTHWISKYKDSGSVDDAPRAGRPRKLSARVERAVEKKMRGKRRRSSRVIEWELKRQKVVRCELQDSAENSAPSRFARIQTA